MWINEAVMLVLAIFFLIGALDLMIGNKFGMGESFKEGLFSMGTLALAMIGIITLAPIAAELLIPFVSPLYIWIGADPASFANTLLALDMGGYALAERMSLDPEAALFSWVFLGTMLGPTIVFTLPVALTLIQKDDHRYFAKGILIGLSTIPLGCFIGGALGGFQLGMMLVNLLIPFIFSILIMIGLWKIPNQSIKVFIYFGKFIQVLAIFGLMVIGLEILLGYQISSNTASFSEGLMIVGSIAIVLAGAFPLVAFVSKFLDKYLEKLGHVIGLDGKSVTGLIASLAHIIPAFLLLKEMSPRGKVVVVAFSVSGAFVLGGHLGFVAGVNRDMVIYMMIGKLVAGISAALIALFLEKRGDTKGTDIA
ncbi:ethanolamine utilization protein EutH [Alkalicoccobacillus porphyridii]|uniref:Ethanolamine utilization protein EutH n=2 Tax=Alkalicoccobacillus porphyridii TaxID=2597270 RepID=A0A554A1K2_9BACI|nr:ethanolamine utilization protein EutH [Alkalicoccobacillus porphyridii]